MGSYGIGVGRVLASIVEAHHDANGIIWPVTVAPVEVVVSVLNPTDVEPQEAGERLYDALRQQGIDVLLDLRDERPGVKFKDADLVGIPHRIVVGPRGLAEKKVEANFTEALREYLAKKGFDPQMGARPMARLIQDTIRSALADELLFGRLAHGGKITVDIDEAEKIRLIFAEETAGVA